MTWLRKSPGMCLVHIVNGYSRIDFNSLFLFLSLVNVNGSGENMSSSRSHGEGTIPSQELRRRQVNILGILLKVLNSDE
jgi:hypothetical protein